MSTMRVIKNKNYTVMANYHLREKSMTLKAKGLLSVMLSLPPEWDYSVNGLCSICKENITAIRSTLDELKQFGYLEVVKLLPNQTESGRIEYNYNIYEEPQERIKQDAENLHVENLHVENPLQLNTNNSLLKKENTYLYREKSEKQEKEKKRTDKQQTSSFDTEEFYQAALRRSYEDKPK